jgi:hypothetical protein
LSISSGAGQFIQLWIILIGGGLGAIVYIFVEVLPDFGLLRSSFKVFPGGAEFASLKRDSG